MALEILVEMILVSQEQTPNNNFGDNIFDTMNNNSSSTTSNAMQGEDLFGVSSMTHNGDNTNGSGMDMFFDGPISSGSSNSHPAKPVPRNDVNNGSGGSNNLFLISKSVI